jgi:hypothetical protein
LTKNKSNDIINVSKEREVIKMTIKEASKEVLENTETGKKYREWVKQMIENSRTMAEKKER